MSKLKEYRDWIDRDAALESVMEFNRAEPGDAPPFDPVRSPGHTDLMVTPESLGPGDADDTKEETA